MNETLQTLAKLSVLVFVVSSMLAMGLSLTIAQIIAPLRNGILVMKAIAANFIVAPLLAYLILLVIPLSEAQSVGLVLLATAAGAPFLPKLVQASKGNVAFAVGLMVLLMIVTVAYVPLVLPLLLRGVQVDTWSIARSLIVLMLLPLGIGLAVRARYGSRTGSVQRAMAQASNVALIFLFVLGLILNFQNLIGVVGTGAILAALLLIVLTFAAGYLLGGPARDTRPVLALGTAQRNIAAALVVGAQNFSDPDVIVMLMVGAVLMLAVLMLTAGELGRRSRSSRTRAEASALADGAGE